METEIIGFMAGEWDKEKRSELILYWNSFFKFENMVHILN